MFSQAGEPWTFEACWAAAGNAAAAAITAPVVSAIADFLNDEGRYIMVQYTYRYSTNRPKCFYLHYFHCNILRHYVAPYRFLMYKGFNYLRFT